MRLAITREVSPAIARCELTHLSRQRIDLEKARGQHAAYERCLADAGCTVTRLPAGADVPDSVFVEDIALVFDEIAVITRPGAESRRLETPMVAAAVGAHRSLVHIEAPGTMDGGDVLVVGRRIFVGESNRTNAAAVEQLKKLMAPYGYQVEGVPVRGCLHLKSAVTAISGETLLINRDWAPIDRLSSFDLLDVHPQESWGANALSIEDTVIYPTGFPRTRRRMEDRGLHVVVVDVGEIAKAEGAVTCCSLIFAA